MSRTFFVTRHAGAIDWLRQHMPGADAVDLDDVHDASDFRPGDRVFGVVPLQTAAALCERGVEVHAISVRLPRGWRGRELSADALCGLGARLIRYTVVAHPPADLGVAVQSLAGAEAGPMWTSNEGP